MLAATKKTITSSLISQLSEKPKNIRPPSRNNRGEIRKFQKFMLNLALTESQIKSTLKNTVASAAHPKKSGLIRLISSPLIMIKL